MGHHRRRTCVQTKPGGNKVLTRRFHSPGFSRYFFQLFLSWNFFSSKTWAELCETEREREKKGMWVQHGRSSQLSFPPHFLLPPSSSLKLWSAPTLQQKQHSSRSTPTQSLSRCLAGMMGSRRLIATCHPDSTSQLVISCECRKIAELWELCQWSSEQRLPLFYIDRKSVV